MCPFVFTPTQRSRGLQWQGVKEDEKPKKPAKQAEVALADHFVLQIHPKWRQIYSWWAANVLIQEMPICSFNDGKGNNAVGCYAEFEAVQW